MKGNGILKIVAVTLLAMALFASFLLAQVWKQNYYIRLKKDSISLQKDFTTLQSEIAAIDLQIRELKNYNRLEKIGRELGLDFHGTPELIFKEGSQ